ncbi:hypothetical protein SFUMM280S_09965 [Streptomyces fumanus]
MHERSSAPASWRVALPHTAAAVPVARALIRTALTELAHTADCDTAELLTAELVANAVEHTAGDAPIELVVELLPTSCQVEVHDPDPAPPVELTRPVLAEPDPWQRGRARAAADPRPQLQLRPPRHRVGQGGLVQAPRGTRSAAPGVTSAVRASREWRRP